MTKSLLGFNAFPFNKLPFSFPSFLFLLSLQISSKTRIVLFGLGTSCSTSPIPSLRNAESVSPSKCASIPQDSMLPLLTTCSFTVMEYFKVEIGVSLLKWVRGCTGTMWGNACFGQWLHFPTSLTEKEGENNFWNTYFILEYLFFFRTTVLNTGIIFCVKVKSFIELTQFW